MKNIIKYGILIVVFACMLFSPEMQAQVRKMTLNEALQLARKQSREALSAKHRFRSSYWEYRTYKAQYLPMLNFSSTFPSLSRSIIKYTTVEGKDIFLEQSVANYGMEMSLNKTIGFTGGKLYLKTGLDRIDNLSDSTTTSYLSNPVTIGLQQPVFGYNQYRWDNKIEPLKYKEAKQSYLEQVEQINIDAINYYFDVIQAELSLKIARINQANYDTLYKIAKGRYNLGRIAENELLQLELSYLKANAGVETAELDFRDKVFRFKSFLCLPENEEIELLLPDSKSNINIDVSKAVGEAKSNRSEILAFQRKIFEAESQVHQARLENRFSANLYAEYGLTQSSADFEKVYKDPQDEQLVSFGISVPILDWGLARGKIKMAQSNREMVKTSVEQQQIDFEQDVFLQVMQYNMQQNQLNIAAKSDTVAQKRYFVTKQRYLIGKIDITDLNIAQTETDAAQLGFITALRSYWNNFYAMRKLTLFDFKDNKKIDVDFNELIK